MKMRIHFAIPVAFVCILLAHGARSQCNRIGPADIYPDPVRTPGAANPQITQENIRGNICNRQWSTKLIRPPAGYTGRLKRKQLREYGDTVHQARAHIENIERKFLVAAPMNHADVEWPTPLAMRGNHFAALGEFLVSSQPWPKLKA